MQPNNTNTFNANQDGAHQQSYAQSFYDPSSADGYVNMMSANASLSGNSSATGSGSQPLFRDSTHAPSPLSSPRTSIASPYLHQRTSSQGSDQVYPATMGQAFDSVDSLGRIGQISLDEGNRQCSAFEGVADTGHASSFQSTPGESNHVTAYGSLAGAATSSSLNSSSNSSSSSSSNSNSSIASASGNIPSHTNTGAAPQLTLGIPKVTVSDTSMDYTPVASMAASNTPSINVMAPSPSTPRAHGQHGQDGGFQDILAQLATAHGDGVGMASIQEGEPSQEPWLNDSTADANIYSRLASVPTQSSTLQGAADNSNSWLQSPSNDAPIRPHSASGRLVPQSYNEEPSQLMSAFDGMQSRSNAPHGPGQWSSQAKRQDSYDKIRQFLRLDVDMGYQNSGKTESPTLAMFRKRANSDIGPRSPISGGTGGGSGGTAFDWSLPLAAQTQDAVKPVSTSDWDMFKVKLESQFPDNQAFMNSLIANAGLANMQTFPQNTMDPSLLDGNHQPHASFDSSTQRRGLSAPQSHQPQVNSQEQLHPSQQQQQQQIQQQQSQQQEEHMQHLTSNYAHLNSSGGFAARFGYPDEFNTQWRFPGDNAPLATGKPKMRRGNSPRNSQAGHRRLAQSEDLSQSRLYQGPTEDFVSRITAMNGGLAPPTIGRTISNSNGASGQSATSLMGSARVHPYRQGRHSSFSSNASTSSAGSASPLPPMLAAKRESSPTYYSQTAQPMYGALGQGMGQSSMSGMISEGDSPMMDAPAVPVVTSQATQAASASRRKAEALFACPVAGCGSTFTRQYNLRGHLRSHADERPYKCEWPGCDKSFARSHDCKRHQNLHLNIKPHTCELCGKTFARLDALNRHHKSDNSGCNTGTDGSSSGQSNSASSSADSRSNSYHSADAIGEQTMASTDGLSKHTKAFGGHVL